jgi:xanthine dehydrogenase accessory factor
VRVSRPDLQERAMQLREQRLPFVLARVVRATKPTSAKPGDEAIVHSDGSIEGFVGGTCAESTVRAESLALLESREPVLLRITPDADGAVGETEPGTRTVHNPCLSGGALEIFLEPVVPAPLVLVHGAGPVAGVLEILGGGMSYRVDDFDAELLGEAEAVVLAAHGRDEIAVLEGALDANVPYVALVASRRRGDAVLAELAGTRPDLHAGDRVHTPAGLDIGAKTAAEIAISILAQIIQERAHRRKRIPGPALSVAATAVDPVCGMAVAAVEPSLQIQHAGTTYYFCGSGCLRAFSAEPGAFLSAAPAVPTAPTAP